MIDLQTIISLYFPIKFERVAAYEAMCDDQSVGKHVGSLSIESEKYGIKAYASFYGPVSVERGVQHYILSRHSADKELRLRSEVKCRRPFSTIDATEVFFHGLYLNVMAFLMNKRVDQLALIHLPSGSTFHIIQFQPDLGAILLEHYNLNFRGPLENKLLSQKLLTSAPVVYQQPSFFPA